MIYVSGCGNVIFHFGSNKLWKTVPTFGYIVHTTTYFLSYWQTEVIIEAGTLRKQQVVITSQ